MQTRTLQIPPADPGRRRRLLLVGLLGLLVVALCVGLLVQRATRTTGGGSADGAANPSAPGTTVPGLALPGSSGAVVRLQTDAGLVRVDLGSGAVLTTAAPTPAGASTLLAGPGWVLTKTPGSSGGALLRDGGVAQVLPPLLQQASQLVPAGDDDVWALPDASAQDTRTAVRVDLQGGTVGGATIRVAGKDGSVVGSIGDALVLNGRSGTYEARAGSTRRVSEGFLLAVGTDGTLTWDCDSQDRCDARTNRSGHDPAFFPGARKSLQSLYGGTIAKAPGRVGALSPNRRWVALPLPAPTRRGSSLVVVDLRTGNRVEVPGPAAAAGTTDLAAFTPNSRYLLAVTDGRLRVVDLRRSTVTTPDGAPTGLLHLAIAQTSAF